jgi:hypothetical protein
MVDIVDFIQTNGVGIGIILLVPLLIMFGYVGLSLASTYISSPISHISPQTYCATIPHGVYTIFPGYLTLLSLGGSTSYSSLFLISACIGNSVYITSLALWYLEIIPIALIAEIIRQRVVT